MKILKSCAFAMLVTLSAATSAVAQSSQYQDWQATTDKRTHKPSDDGCWNFHESAQGYVNSCGEYIPSQDDLDSTPGGG
ncbi:MAG: hypothetical protein P4L68_00835 [Methylovirgula sp.]|nr:hypothetical protein [Methylovirgula sp.]